APELPDPAASAPRVPAPRAHVVITVPRLFGGAAAARGVPFRIPPQQMKVIGAVAFHHGVIGVGPPGLARLEQALGHLADAAGVDELVVVAAAGGLEAYFTAPDPHAAARTLGEAVAALAGTDREVTRWEGVAAAGRLFR